MKKTNIDVSVGKRLRTRRTQMGLTQAKIARVAGITFQQVQKYEKGSNAMNATRLYAFSQLMRVPVMYFFEDLVQVSSGSHSKDVDNLDATKSDRNLRGASDRESLELMKAFKEIKEQVVRKRIADLVRGIADNKAIID